MLQRSCSEETQRARLSTDAAIVVQARLKPKLRGRTEIQFTSDDARWNVGGKTTSRAFGLGTGEEAEGSKGMTT